MFRDLRLGIRQWGRSPGFAAIAILTLGLGIGISTSIFCLLDGMWLRPMSVPHSSDLVRLSSVTPRGNDNFSYPELEQIQKNVPALRAVVASGNRGGRLVRADGSMKMLLVNVVSPNFFEDLGVKAAAGRVFTAHEDQQLRENPVVVLGQSVWKQEFGGDPSIVGRQIKLMRGDKISLFTVLGVLPDEFRETDPSDNRDIWMPPQTWEQLGNNAPEFRDRNFRWFRVIGRLAPGSTIEQAQTQLHTLSQSLTAQWPESNKNRSFTLVSDLRYRMRDAGVLGTVLLAIVGMIVLLAAVNVAQLLLARSLSRQREFALRQVLGAGRMAMLRVLFAENLALGAAGLFTGLIMSLYTARLLPTLIVTPSGFTPGYRFGVDWRVMGFAAIVSLISVVIVSLAPLARVSRSDLAVQINAAGGTGSMRSSRTGRALVVAQIAVSIALLVSTGVLVRSFLNTRTADIGITRKPVLSVWLWASQKDNAQKYDAAQQGLQGLPGVTEVAAGLRAPMSFSNGGMSLMVKLPDHPEIKDAVEIKYNEISHNFLKVLGTPLVRGRSFTEAEVRANEKVMVINEAMAERYWAGDDPIGKIVNFQSPYQIIGVARNAPINKIGEPPEPYLYLPLKVRDAREITFLVETKTSGMELASAVRRVLTAVDPVMDPIMIMSISDIIHVRAGTQQMTAELVSILGVVGLLLTAAGLYGFMSYRVTQRTRELGIRMALGSTESEAVRIVLKESATLGAFGVLLGVPLSIVAAKAASSVLFGISPWDAVSWAMALTVLVVSLWLASYLPARRAAAVEPMQALRME